jgi:hypothetical protein
LNASLAAATARATSSSPPPATVAQTVSVRGFTTSNIDGFNGINPFAADIQFAVYFHLICLFYVLLAQSKKLRSDFRLIASLCSPNSQHLVERRVASVKVV